MRTEELIERARAEFTRLTRSPVNSVTGFTRISEGGVVSLEVLERKAIPDSMDILGVYEVQLDGEGNFVSFQRKRLRKRGETKDE